MYSLVFIISNNVYLKFAKAVGKCAYHTHTEGDCIVMVMLSNLTMVIISQNNMYSKSSHCTHEIYEIFYLSLISQ